MSFIKLKDVTGFTVQSVGKAYYQAWDSANSKMLKSDTYVKSEDPAIKYRRACEIETDQGTLTVSEAQLSQMLVAWNDFGKADINGKSFKVKNNGQTGKDIRYFINADYDQKPKAAAIDPQIADENLPF